MTDPRSAGPDSALAALALLPALTGAAPAMPALPDWAALAGGAAAAVAGLGAAVWLGARARREVVRRRAAEATSAALRRQFGAITDAMREAVVAYDLGLRFQFANPAFVALTGFTLQDLAEQAFGEHIHPDDRKPLLAEWGRLARGQPLLDQEYRIVTRGRAVRWVSSSWLPMRDEEGRQIGYLGTEIDISERKAAEDEMRQDTLLFQAVMEVQQAVTAAGLDSATVVQVIAERSQALTHATGAVVELVRGDELIPQYAVGAAPAQRLRIGASLSGLSVRSGEVLRSDDVATDPRVDGDAYPPAGIHSMLVVPLRHDRQTIGVLKVVSGERRAFGDRDARALRLLGGLMGAALSHAAAFEARQTRLEERTRALQESEQRFKQLVDVAQEGIWVVDDRGMLTYVNQRLADLLGYAPGEMLGRAVYDFLDPAARPAAQRAIGQPQPGARHPELRFRRKDGGEVWGLVAVSPILAKDGGLVGTVGLVSDITHRKQAEDQLRRSAERLAMLHDIDQAVLAARSPAEIGRAALGRMRRMVPCERCSVVLFDFETSQAQLIAGYNGPLHLSASAVPLASFSSTEVLRRGTVRYLEDLAEASSPSPMLRQLRDAGLRSLLSVPLQVEGETTGELSLASLSPGAFTAEHRDIAIEVAAPLAIAIQQARLREELARQAADLERRVAERGVELRSATAELDGFLYSVSHDLRAPLRHVGGFARILLEEHGPRLDADARHCAERIQLGMRGIGELIDDLILLSRIGRQDLVRRPADLGLLVEDVQVQLAGEMAGRNIEWQVEPLPTVRCDPTLARIAVAQLLENAVKFTRPQSRAVIRVFPVEVDGHAGLGVQDNGVGFDPAYAGRLFGLFQRLHRADEFEGHGAGLAVVQRIAQKHGGRVWAESEPGCGATFYLTFGGSATAGEVAPVRVASGADDE